MDKGGGQVEAVLSSVEGAERDMDWKASLARHAWSILHAALYHALKGAKVTISLAQAKNAVLGPNCMLKHLWGWIKNKGIKKRI